MSSTERGVWSVMACRRRLVLARPAGKALSWLFNVCETINLYYNGLISVHCRGKILSRQGLAVFCLPMPKLILKILIIAIVFAAPAYAQPQASFTDKEVKERIAVLKDSKKDPDSRIEAARDLGKANTKAARKALRAAMRKEKNPGVKARLVDAFGEKPDKDAVKELGDMAREDESSDSRSAAVRALGFSRDASVVPLLIEKFNDQNEELGVRLRAADALTQYPTDEVFNAYAAALSSPTREIRVQALVSMYNAFGSDKARVRPHLERMTGDPGAAGMAKIYLERLGQ